MCNACRGQRIACAYTAAMLSTQTCHTCVHHSRITAAVSIAVKSPFINKVSLVGLGLLACKRAADIAKPDGQDPL